MRFTPSRWLSSSLALVSVGTAYGQFWTINTNGTPTAINDSGIAAGYNTTQYFTWSAGGGLVGIGGVVPGNGNGGWPSISADGTQVGATANNPVTGKSEMAYYRTNTGMWTTCGSLGSYSGSSASAGFAMNSAGSILAGNAWISAGNTHAVVWSGGTMTDLGSNLSTRSTRANGVSDDGSLVGGWQDRSDGYRSGAVWVNGAETVLTVGGNPLADVNAVSGDGQWAVGNGGAYAFGQAYMWNRSTGLSFLNSPFDTSMYDTLSATAVSRDGSVVVGYARDTNPLDWGTPDIGWIWTSGTGVEEIGAWATAQGFNIGGNSLTDPTGISPDGRYIVGYGYAPNGFTTLGWVVSTPVPEPATLGVLAIGTLAVLRRRKSR